VDRDCFHIEVHLLRHRDPAHLDIDVVFACEVEHAALLDFEIAEHFAQANVSGEQQCARSLSFRDMPGERIDKLAH